MTSGQVTDHLRSVLAPNAGPMTLDGTNSLVISGDGRTAVVVDPGPPDPDHLAALVAGPPVELILITHHHIDHTEAAAELSRMTGAPVRAFAAEQCHGGGSPLVDGEVIDAAGVRFTVLHTPGHTADSVCFVVEPDGVVLTGDTILGRGTTMITDLADYLGTLETLAGLGADRDLVVVPAHGQVLPSLAEVAGAYWAHRRQRLDQVRGVLARLDVDVAALDPGGAAEDAVVAAMIDEHYTDIDPRNLFAAQTSVRAQLEYLRRR